MRGHRGVRRREHLRPVIGRVQLCGRRRVAVAALGRRLLRHEMRWQQRRRHRKVRESREAARDEQRPGRGWREGERRGEGKPRRRGLKWRGRRGAHVSKVHEVVRTGGVVSCGGRGSRQGLSRRGGQGKGIRRTVVVWAGASRGLVCEIMVMLVLAVEVAADFQKGPGEKDNKNIQPCIRIFKIAKTAN